MGRNMYLKFSSTTSHFTQRKLIQYLLDDDHQQILKGLNRLDQFQTFLNTEDQLINEGHDYDKIMAKLLDICNTFETQNLNKQ